MEMKSFRARLHRDGFVAACLEDLTGWARSRSISALSLESGCCAETFFEGAQIPLRENDISPVLNPRHADVLIVSGGLSFKMLPVVRRIYDQMPFPKSVMVLGSCACGGGLFAGNYAVASDLSEYLPVDAYVAGCPPSRASFMAGVKILRKKMYAEATS